MPIELQNPEFVKLYGQAALLTGESLRAKEEYRQNIEIAERLNTIRLQKEMAEFNQQLDIDRMKFASLLGFEKEKRAQTWDLEKMEQRSRIDFQQEEAKRLKNQQEFDLGLKYIKEKVADGTIPPDEGPRLEFDLTMEKVYKAPSVNIPKPVTEKPKIPTSYEQWELYKELGLMPQEGGLAPTNQLTQPHAIAEPKSEQEYNALPVGSTYRYIDGSIRTKK